MGAAPSKDESLYHQVKSGNIAEIGKLHRNGAGLEWVDKEGQTPLVLACKRSALFPVAKLLIELGANVNAYRPGPHAGTPLHHAAKHGLKETVNLLLSHGANPLLMNGARQTALDLARAKGHSAVVRSIENRICLFSGWLREFHGPIIFEAIIPQLVSRKLWAVVVPCTSLNQTQPPKLDLALYSDLQVAKPRAIIQLWNSRIKQPNFSQLDPTVVIEDIAGKTKSRLASAKEGDRDQLLMFHNACRGFPQTGNNIPATPVAAVTPTPVNPLVTKSRTPPTATTDPSPEDVELEMAMNASIQSAISEGALPLSDNNIQSNALPPASPPPSAPPMINPDIFYNSSPSVDSSPINRINNSSSNNSNSCAVCLDAAVEGACIPCGHMAGCMACLNEIHAKQWGCPVCRTPIEQIIKLYTV
ncbi:hypothetical protein J5N97_023345 [Dioscorea zingiberensis]|uniref:RING-type domain-containing protein n=1 Tax=Dioscorea zingiberensis TaxID=325984 RepID=A0A9D5CC50_9LILI|nr:hypothetical protein J5N97_023345 [Dioscorea zingiberensis]